jgi:hypothetical protein
MICVILVAGHGYVLEEEIKVWPDFVFVEDSLTMLMMLTLTLPVTATTK